MLDQETELNEAAYRRMEASINDGYPFGQYVAIAGGQIVADAADFDELQDKLRTAGRDPFQAFIVQAGHVYPKHAIILNVG